MKVIVKQREKDLFNGYATSVTSFNDVGEFDILAQHANFITLIKDEVILNKNQQKEKSFKIDTGVLQSVGDRIVILV